MSTIESYRDLLPTISRALLIEKTIRLECASENMAVNTLQRLNRCRALLRQSGDNTADKLVFRRPKGSRHIVIEPRRFPFVAAFDGDGKELDIRDFREQTWEEEVAEYERLGKAALQKPALQSFDPDKPLFDDTHSEIDKTDPV